MPKKRGTVLVSKRRKIDDVSDVPVRAIKGAGSANALDAPPQILDDMIRILKENKHILIIAIMLLFMTPFRRTSRMKDAVALVRSWLI